jgi:hypothetical protein
MFHRLFYFRLAATIVLLAAMLPAASAGDIKVIGNPDVGASTISAADLKAIFLATKSSLGDGAHVEPVLQKDGPAHAAFLKQYLGKSDAALQTYFRSLVFSGKGSMPKAFATDAEVVAYVSKTKGAVGYVDSGAATSGVKTIEVR